MDHFFVTAFPTLRLTGPFSLVQVMFGLGVPSGKIMSFALIFTFDISSDVTWILPRAAHGNRTIFPDGFGISRDKLSGCVNMGGSP